MFALQDHGRCLNGPSDQTPQVHRSHGEGVADLAGHLLGELRPVRLVGHDLHCEVESRHQPDERSHEQELAREDHIGPEDGEIDRPVALEVSSVAVVHCPSVSSRTVSKPKIT